MKDLIVWLQYDAYHLSIAYLLFINVALMKKSLISVLWLFSVLVLIGCGGNSAPTQDTTTPTQNTQAQGTPSDSNDAGEDTVPAAQNEVAVDLEYTTRLANCMTENGLIMYGTTRCSHCQTQKALFGDAFANVTYVDCDEDRQVCLDAGVRGFPTWIDGENNAFPGTQTLDRLAAISGCEDIQ